ncbi:hypothetical protein EDB86DRAFT_3245561 [Lactarius hatsudake]|nr:hypothetical protein EDB86DRAFT_3245561 [Lactarius hatsudake]
MIDDRLYLPLGFITHDSVGEHVLHVPAASGTILLELEYAIPNHKDSESDAFLYGGHIHAQKASIIYALAPAGASLDHEATTSAGSSSRFQDIFNAALKSYQKQTNKDLIAHPLASQLQSCDSTSAILAVLLDQVREFDQARSDNERLIKWLIPTVNVLYAFSTTVSEGVGLVFSPAKVIFAGIGVFLLAAKDVAASKDALAELFERIGFFFNRLETYTEVTPTVAMTNIITKIMVEVLTIFGIATKELRRGSASEFLIRLSIDLR